MSNGEIYRVPPAGGTASPVTKLDASQQEAAHRWPQFLPDGKRFLFTIRGGPAGHIGVWAGSLDGKTKKHLVHFDSSATYAPPGYLIFMDGDTLLGQAFDADRLEVSGAPFTIADHVGHSTLGYGAFSASVGALAYSGSIVRTGSPDLV